MRAPTLRELRVEAGRRGLGKRISVRRLRLLRCWEYTIYSLDELITIRCLAPTKAGARAATGAALKTVPWTREGRVLRDRALVRKLARGAW